MRCAGSASQTNIKVRSRSFALQPRSFQLPGRFAHSLSRRLPFPNPSTLCLQPRIMEDEQIELLDSAVMVSYIQIQGADRSRIGPVKHRPRHLPVSCRAASRTSDCICFGTWKWFLTAQKTTEPAICLSPSCLVLHNIVNDRNPRRQALRRSALLPTSRIIIHCREGVVKRIQSARAPKKIQTGTTCDSRCIDFLCVSYIIAGASQRSQVTCAVRSNNLRVRCFCLLFFGCCSACCWSNSFRTGARECLIILQWWDLIGSSPTYHATCPVRSAV